ncbi:MAG: ABC transporter permease subunit [Chloroflexi bacterium]|nr:ABC transporter permease subunit [Chloroflexota bacterium]
MAAAQGSSASELRRILTLWRNVRVQRFVGQTVFAAIVIYVGYLLISNMSGRLDQIGLSLFPFVDTTGSFPFISVSGDFLNQRAGFDIVETSFGYDYGPNDSYRDAYFTGFLNTIRVSGMGIVFATIIGVFIGVSRQSKNWLVSHAALAYVETFRNVPLLLQLIFWYVAIYLKLPRISNPLDLDIAIVTNKAIALPFVSPESGFGIWMIVLLAGAAAGAAAYVVRSRRQDATGLPSHPGWWALGAFGAIGLIGFLATGLPLETDTPSIANRQVIGGLQMTPEFGALLTGLTLYTAAFIAENVRGSIQAIPKGQTEAAAALGLGSFQRMRYVILPQTLRILIPPTTNQYLNLTKNSSLAFVLAFKDVFGTGSVIITQTGQAVPIIALLMITYLSLSLFISLVMNTINSRLKWENA